MKVIAGALGLSPPVITAPLRSLKGVGKLVVFTTEEEEVRRGYELIEVALQQEYPEVLLKRVELGFADVSSEEENFEFMRIAGRIIRAEKEEGNTVYVNLAGGRKNMSLSLALIAQMLNARMFHVVNREVKSYNLLLENLRGEIRRIYESGSEERFKIYAERRRHFRELLFPEDAALVWIPAIPMPREYLQRVVEALFTGRTENLTPSQIGALEEVGLVERVGRKVAVSELGRKLGEVLVR